MNSEHQLSLMTSIKLAVRDELSDVLRRLAVMETHIQAQAEKIQHNDADARLTAIEVRMQDLETRFTDIKDISHDIRTLEKQISSMTGKVAAVAALTPIIVTMLFKLIGTP